MNLTNAETEALRALAQNPECELSNEPKEGQVNAAAALSLARRGLAVRVASRAQITAAGLEVAVASAPVVKQAGKRRGR